MPSFFISPHPPDFNPRPPRGGRLTVAAEAKAANIISIHAPREGGDVAPLPIVDSLVLFQSTPPARGATIYYHAMRGMSRGFQSTPPARGATRRVLVQAIVKYDFNPRPPRGGRRRQNSRIDLQFLISIHAPREGGDQSVFLAQYPEGISIHAPREGGDSKDAQFYLRIFDK